MKAGILFPCLLVLVSAQFDAGRRRSPASQANTNARRRRAGTPQQAEIKRYQQSGKEDPLKLMELINKEQHMQIMAHDETRNQREEEQSTLINRLAGEDGRKGAFMKKMIKLQEVIARMRRSFQGLYKSQDGGKEMARYTKAQLQREFGDIRYLDELGQKDLRDRMDFSVKSLLSDISRADADLKSKRENVERIVGRDTETAVTKLDDTYKRVKQSVRAVNLNVDRMQVEHETNLAKIDVFAKQFKLTYGNIESVLERIPEMLEAKGEELDESIGEESDERGDAFKETTTKFNKIDKDLQVKLGKVSQNQGFLYEAMQETSKDASEENHGLVEGDLKEMESSLNGANLEMRNDMKSSFGDVDKELRNLDIMIASTSDELTHESEKQKSFPTEANAALDVVKDMGNQAANALRESRAETAEQINAAFETSARALGTQALGDIKKKLVSMSGMGQQTIATSTSRAIDGIRPLVDQLDDLVSTGKDMDANLEEDATKSADSATRFENMEIELKTQGHVVKDDIHKRDRILLTQAKAQGKEQTKAVVHAGESIAKAKSQALQAAAEKSEELTADFDEKADVVDADFTSKVKGLESQVDKVNMLGEKMKSLLGKKIAKIDMSLTDVRMSQMPALIKGGEDFMKMANAKIDAVPTVVDNAVEAASGLVSGHMDGLSAVADNSMRGLKNVITPLEQRNRKLVQNGKQLLSGMIGTMKDDAKQMAAESTGLLDGSNEKNAANAGGINSATEEMENQFSNAKDAIAGYDNDLTDQLNSQRNQLTQVEMNMAADTTKSVALTKERKDVALKSAKGAMDEAVTSTDKEVGSAWKRLDDAVARVTDKIEKDGGKLGKRTKLLGGILTQVKMELSRLKATSVPALDAVHRQLDEEDAADRAASAQESAEVEKKGDALESSSSDAINNAETKAEKDVALALKDAETDAKNSQAAISGQEELMDGAISSSEEKVNSEVKTLSDGAGSFVEKMKAEAKSSEQHDADLKSAFSEIEQQNSESNMRFERGMSAAGALLANLAGKDNEEMQKVVAQLASTTATTKTDTSAQTAADHELLKTLIEASKKEQTEVSKKVAETNKGVDAFAAKLNTAEEGAEDAIQEGENLQGDFSRKLGSKSERFAASIHEETLARQNQTHALMSESGLTVDKIDSIMNQVTMLEKKVNGQVTWHTGTLDLDDKNRERTISEALKLEEYQDADALKKLKSKARTAWDQENELLEWKKENEFKTKDFRNLVDGELAKLGEELDLTELDLAKEKAAESFAAQSAMEHLSKSLGTEVEGLSGMSKGRLQSLAAKAGAEIAALTKDESLSASERAAKIREIKAELERKGKEIIDDDGRLALEQETAARNMVIATHEVTDEMERVGELGGSTTPAAGLQHTIDRIKNLLEEATHHLSDTPVNSLAEVSALDPTEMIESANEHSVKSMKQDDKTASQLDQLIKQFS